MADKPKTSSTVSYPSKMQGSTYFCPNGHVMIVEGQGSLNITGICNKVGCEHRSVRYKITLPTIILTKV